MDKFLKLFTFLFAGALSIYAQNLTTTENYIYTRAYLDAVTAPSSSAKQVEGVVYLDGLGREKQQIALKATPLQNDMVVPVFYEDGKQKKSYLPIPVSSLNGAYQTGISGNSASTYYGVPNAFTEIAMEKSPLSRVTKSGSVGDDWALGGNNSVEYQYLSNSTNEVKRLEATTTWNSSKKMNDISIAFAADDPYTTGGFFNKNTLHKNIVKDEDDKEIQVFTDTNKKTILVRKLNETGKSPFADTYYVYDVFGNLVLVIPPNAATFTTLSELNSYLDTLCYQYRYDKHDRQVEKRLPGKNYWEYVVYDKQNRPILSQDANQHGSEWAFVKYDSFSRITYTGLYSSSMTRTTLQTTIDANTANPLNNEIRSTSYISNNGQSIYYTNVAFPTTGLNVMQIHYYDDYPAGSATKPSTILGESTMNATETSYSINGVVSIRSTKGLPTVSLIKNIENNAWTKAHVWYDIIGRPIGTHSINHLGGYTKTEKQLSFSGALLVDNLYHKRLDADAQVEVRQHFDYDASNRLLRQYHQVDSGLEVLLAEYEYNELGEVVNKKVGDNLQSIDYTYNIRGWLTGINKNALSNLSAQNKLFGYEMRYQDPEYDNLSQGRFNGNISEITWNSTAPNVSIKRYNYQYDDLNRLVNAQSSNPDWSIPQNHFNDETVNYDLNGNIVYLKRYARPLGGGGSSEQIDELVYSYNGNQLTSVQDYSGNSTGYEGGNNQIDYDQNGNMTTMKDKGIQNIGYNFLNLPNSISIQGNNKKALYLYRADGTKIRKIFNSNQSDSGTFATVTDYIDGFHYLTTQGTPDNNEDPMGYAYEQEAFIQDVLQLAPNTTLKFFPTTEGFYDYENNEYIYQYKDHLGNVRISYKKVNGVAEITDQNDYYAFGMNIPREKGSIIGTANLYNYKLNSKEIQETGFSDFGWRQYAPDLGRWFGIDQLAEAYDDTSPYAYVKNNPLSFIDPDGRCASNAEGNFQSGDCAYLIETVVLTPKKKVKSAAAGNSNSANPFPNIFSFVNSSFSGFGSPDGGGGAGGGDGGNYLIPRGSGEVLDKGFRWINQHPLEITAGAGIIESGSLLTAKGLKNWNAPSNAIKTKIIAETISTKLPASAKFLQNASPYLKWGGRAVGAVGIANTYYQWRQGNISDVRASFDTAMGVVGFLGPWGAGVSLVYFGGIAIYENYPGEPLF